MSERRLYTEDSVRALRPGTELVLGRDALATPAALDLAYARGIIVRWEDGSTSPAAGSPASAATHGLERLLEADGDYLVQVQNGRPRLYRLTPDGPQLL